ncbi:MAG: hypothetical protein KC478_13445 [Bacteriovoracaceae bacterium]|nr:hypothetical protein [Bacteriovoracaceae bacterium]
MKLIFTIITLIGINAAYAEETAFLRSEETVRKALDHIRVQTGGELDFSLTNVKASTDPRAKFEADVKLNGKEPCRDISFDNAYDTMPKYERNLEDKDREIRISKLGGVLREVNWIFQMFGVSADITHWKSTYSVYMRKVFIPACYID